MNKEILVTIDSLDRYRFFKRLIKPFSCLGYNTHFITSLTSVSLGEKKSSCFVTLCKKSTSKRNFDVKRSLEYCIGETDEDLTNAVYSSFFEETQNIIKKHFIKVCIIWNGSRTETLGVSDACKENKIPCVYLEISNIPERIFADPLGVNSHSALYQHPEILDEIQTSEIEYKTWKESYINSSFCRDIPKQAILAHKIKITYLLDFSFWLFKNIQPTISFQELFINTAKKFLPRKKYKPNTIDFNNTRYLFFPMQLSRDSQILFHSNFCNESALKIAYNEAKSLGLDLVVKIHPAETNTNEFIMLEQFRKENNILVSDDNSIQLIHYAQALIVINSSIGLEASILGKPPIKYLGKSIFSKLNDTRLKNFMMNYLIKIDYFENENIPFDQALKILERANFFSHKE